MTATPAEQHLIGGRYRTHDRIGKGRLGEIFAAVDERFEQLGVEQRVAIQIIPESIVGNNTLFNKLNIGYTMLKAGAHPNIVDCLQFGRDDKFGFLAMELLEGASLRVVLGSAETLPPDEVIPVIRSIGNALEYLHAKDIVHGNLTTGSVFVSENLEARLLDVVPLGPSDAIFRGAALSEPIGRCTIQDDVFGLACLAYEMLSGKHPFNYCPPGEARLAGLEAKRIASLSDHEWSALRLALSFERGERTATVTDFMRDFGILGTERLRPAAGQPARNESDTYAAPSVPELAPPAQSTAPAIPVAAVDPLSWNVDISTDSRSQSRRNGKHPIRTALLGMLLAGLAAWSYFGQPAEQFVNVIAYVDETLDLGLNGSGDEFVDVWTADRGVSIVDSPVIEPAASIETADAKPEESTAEPEAANTIEDSVVAAEEVIIQPVTAEPLTVDSATDPVVEMTDEKVDEVLTRTESETALLQADTVIVEPFVSVSEQDAVARITVQHNTSSTAQLTWWTSEGTATADQDFIAVQQQITTGASLADGNVLHIPLINDSMPELNESFFVNFGLRNTENGQIDRIATVRVNIIDDDLR